MYRVLFAVVAVSLCCSGYYASLTDEEKEHYNKIETDMIMLFSKAASANQKIQDEVERAERGAARARGSEVQQAESCLKTVLSMSRSMASLMWLANLNYERRLPFKYPDRVRLYESTLALVESMEEGAALVEKAVDTNCDSGI